MENIGIRIKKIRKILNKSQEELALELGLTKQAISNIETSKSLPSMAFLSKLLLDYDVNLNFIVCGIGEIFMTNEKTYKSLRNSLLKEVEQLLDARGID